MNFKMFNRWNWGFWKVVWKRFSISISWRDFRFTYPTKMMWWNRFLFLLFLLSFCVHKSLILVFLFAFYRLFNGSNINLITLIKHTVRIFSKTLFFMHRKFPHFYNTSHFGQLQNKTSLHNTAGNMARGCLVESIFH